VKYFYKYKISKICKNYRIGIRYGLILSFLFFLSSVLLAHTYYIDATSGNDSNDGRSVVSAWQTLTKVNGTTFVAGDTILFKSGLTWTGQLKPRGSGTSGNPIIIDKYNGTAKPIVNGNGVTGQGTVYLSDQQYWEINNLEITNNAATAGDRRGVFIEASNFGLAQHIYLKNLDIHNVKGTVGQDDAAKRTAGIGFEVTADATPTRFHDILIDGCNIYQIENTGIYTDNTVTRNDYPHTSGWNNRCFTNVRISNNVIHHISKNAMIIRLFDHGVIEHNVCYETALQVTGNTIFTAACDSTIFQYNEGYLNRSPDADGSMYDADLRSPNTIWQYSYSHDNAHGLFWTCTVQEDSGVICRYNISQNDQGIIFCINYPSTSVYCYNNTVYTASNLSPVIISERNVNTGTRKYYFYNNIIYNNSTTATYDFKTSGYTRIINYNVFYGNHPSNEPADAHKLTSDPRLINPGSGGIGISTVSGYQLQASSPCLNSGYLVHNHCSVDFWGNSVPSEGTVDRGAYEQAPLPVQLASFVGNYLTNNTVKLEWVTISEINNYGFYIEKYNTTINQFETIETSFQAGKGTTLEPQHYSWTDENTIGNHLEYRLKQLDNDGLMHFFGPIMVNPNDVSGEKYIPQNFVLQQNYPNPFNPTAVIKYSVPKSVHVNLSVYDLLGKKVMDLVDEYKSAGDYNTRIDGSNLSAGVYFYRISAGELTQTRIFTLIK
jgi:hypothetical protein